MPPLLFPEDPDHKLNDQARRLRAAPHRHDGVTTAIIKCSLDTTFITAATRAAGNHGENRIVGSNLATITTQLLVVCIYSIYRVSTQYLQIIYTVSTLYLQTVSTDYLHGIYTRYLQSVLGLSRPAEPQQNQNQTRIAAIIQSLVTPSH